MARTAPSGARSSPTPRRAGTAATVVLPGQRIPNPGIWRLYAQAAVVLACVVCLLRGWATAWALAEVDAQRAAAGAARVAGASGAPLALSLPTPEQALAWVILHAYPVVYTPLALFASAGLVILCAELALFAVWRIHSDRQVRAEAGRVGVSLLVRLPPPGRPVGGGGSSTDNDVGDELFDSLHSALRAWVSAWGGGPRLSFSLMGRPQTPAQAIVWMPEAPDAVGTTPPRRWFGLPGRSRRTAPTSGVTRVGGTAGDGPMANRLRPILEGVIPGTRADRVPDPLLAVMQPGKHLHWAAVTLSSPASCPLRMGDELEHNLMGPLANSHRARPGTDLVTVQVIMQPLRHTVLRGEWRGQIMRRLMRLESRFEHHLEGDTRRLQAKLAGAPYLVTLYAIAIGDDADVVAQDLEAVLATLEGQYRQTTGDSEQRLTRQALHRLVVPEGWSHTPHLRRSLLVTLAGVAVGLLVGLGTGSPLTGPLTDLAASARTMVPDFSAALGRHRPDADVAHLLLLAGGCIGGLVAAWVERHRSHDAARQQVQRLLARAPRAPIPPRLLLPSLNRAPLGILTAREVEGLWSLPSAQLSGVIEHLPNRYIPPPQVAFCNSEPDRISIGLGRRADGSYAPVGPTLRDLRNILHMTAAMGTGKSRLLTNICAQLMEPGRETGFGLIDGKGDDKGALAYTVLRLMPIEVEERLLWVDLLDLLNPIGLNPLSSDLAGDDQNLTLNQLLIMFARLDPSSWSKSHGMEQYATQAGLLVLEAVTNPTLAHFKQALVNEGYRRELLRSVRNPEVRSFWTEVFPETGENQKSSRDALIRRVDKLLVSPMLRNIFTRPVPTLNVREAIEKNQIVLIPLPSERLGGMARGIGSLLIREVVKGAFARSGNDVDRQDWPLIVDELQVLIDPMSNVDLETVLTRFRALGVPGLYAHQTLGQLGELGNEMVGNVLNHIILRANEPDASFYAKLYSAQGITPADISGQPSLEHQYADLVCRGTPTRLFSYQPHMWPESPEVQLPPYTGPSWRTITAPARGRAERALDVIIDHLALLSNAGKYDPLEVASHLASNLSAEEWQHVKDRWRAHRLAQRDHILAHPGCVPDHMKRRMLISGLRAGEPRLAAIVDYLRVRQALTGTVLPARDGEGGRGGRGRGKGRDGDGAAAKGKEERTVNRVLAADVPPDTSAAAPSPGSTAADPSLSPPAATPDQAPPQLARPAEEPLLDESVW